MNQTIVIGHIALIQKSKKQGFTLEVIKALRDKGYDAVGIFAGECRDPEYLAELQKRVKELCLSRQVAFLGRRSDIPDLLKLMDLIIIPSSEGFPLAGLEAAAAEVPVIACDTAGAEEFIRVSGDGITFKEDNITSAMDAVKKILKNRDNYKNAGIKFAKQMSNQKYSVKIKKIFGSIK